jgi:hypothetical protein
MRVIKAVELNRCAVGWAVHRFTPAFPAIVLAEGLKTGITCGTSTHVRTELRTRGT